MALDLHLLRDLLLVFGSLLGWHVGDIFDHPFCRCTKVSLTDFLDNINFLSSLIVMKLKLFDVCLRLLSRFLLKVLALIAVISNFAYFAKLTESKNLLNEVWLKHSLLIRISRVFFLELFLFP